jgi:hypothetical protein
MRALCLAVAVATLVGFSGCGSDRNAVMPDVTGKRLGVAKSTIKDAGFEDEVMVDGGGAFGVINESNWEVCGQSPARGEAVSGAPRLKVARSCDDAKPSGTSRPSKTPPVTSEPAAPASSEPHAVQVQTKNNNKELAALLALSDPCDEAAGHFAAKYAGRTIAFDGSIADMVNHGDYKTRYDFLISPGDKGPSSTVGPNFKFEDEGIFELKLTGYEIPAYVGEGDRFRFTAEVGEYDPKSCLFFLQPVATRVR